MRKYWCNCGTTVEAEVVFRNGAYEAEFFDPADRMPIEACNGCNEDLYQLLCEGTLSDVPLDRRPRLRLIGSSR